MVTCLMEIEVEEKLGHRLHNGHLPDGDRGRWKRSYGIGHIMVTCPMEIEVGGREVRASAT